MTQYQVHSKSSIDISFETSKLELMRLCFPWYAVFSFKNSAFHSTQGCVAAWMRQGFSEFRWFREECESHSVMSDSLQPMDYTVHGILRPEYWSGLSCPSPGDLPDPGIEPRSPASQADSLPPDPPGKSSLVLRTLNLWNEAALHFAE